VLPERHGAATRPGRSGEAVPVTTPLPEPSTGLDPAAAAEWDARYAGPQRIWSGEPNGALVAEAADLAPGTALDVGCGEGADTVWLAARGWRVSALDVSRVALERAGEHARGAGVQVRWLHAGLLDADLPPAGFDLVAALYPALRRTGPGDEAAERALLAATAVGGTLLVVHHADVDTHHARDAGFDPADYVSPDDVARLLDDDWAVQVHERRARRVASGAGAHHTADVVLRARRLR